MPTGHYGHIKIDNKNYEVVYWSSLKSKCEKITVYYREKLGMKARIIKHPIKKGILAGGIINEKWAVAIEVRERR